MKRRIVAALEALCNVTHPITHHRPWLWMRRLPAGVSINCPLADLSERLDAHWGRTGHWTAKDI